MKLVISVFLCVVLAHDISRANNTYFLPGDAFFFARLSGTDVDRMLKQKTSPVVTFGSYYNGGAGCGSFGHYQLEIAGMTQDEKISIQNAFRLLGPNLEFNAGREPLLNIFIHDTDYDWRKFGFALKYNENWLDESESVGIRRDHARHEFFYQVSESDSPRKGRNKRKKRQFEQENQTAKERQERDAKLVSRLSVEVSPRPDAASSAIQKPVISNKPRMFIILPDRDFGKYMFPADGTFFCIAQNGTCQLFIFSNGQWTSK